MCFEGDIDKILDQVQNCQSDDERRRLLEQASTCRTCPEEKNGALYDHEPGCRCRQQQKLTFNNLTYFLFSGGFDDAGRLTQIGRSNSFSVEEN